MESDESDQMHSAKTNSVSASVGVAGQIVIEHLVQKKESPNGTKIAPTRTTDKKKGFGDERGWMLTSATTELAKKTQYPPNIMPTRIDVASCPLAKPDCSFKMETGNPVICGLEHTSHYQYAKWIRPSDIVLEVGARYGQTTCMLKKLTAGQGEVIAVEPDKKVWAVLEENLKTHKCETQLVKGVIGKTKHIVKTAPGQYRVITGDDVAGETIKGVAYKDVMKGKKASVLAVDCEGCFEDFKKENPDAIADADMLIIEDHTPEEHAAVLELYNAGWKVLDGKDINAIPDHIKTGRMNALVLSRLDREPANPKC